MADYFKMILENNIKIMTTKSEKGFVLEEGVCHNFPEELMLLDDNKLKLLIELIQN